MKTEPRHRAEDLVADVRLHTRRALAAVGRRLAQAVAAGGAAPDLAAAAAFAERCERQLGVATAAPVPGHPLLRLAALMPAEHRGLMADLVLLACLPEAHEAYAALCRGLHPQGLPLPTPALALHWLEREAPAAATTRDDVEDLLCHALPAQLGLFRLEGEGPWHSRSLRPGAGVWAALTARAPRLDDGSTLTGGYATVPGLAGWLAQPGPAQAVLALRRGLPCRIVLVGGDAAMRATRVRALLGAAQASALRRRSDGAAAGFGAAYLAAYLQQSALWLEQVQDDDVPATLPAAPVPELELALPVIQSARDENRLQPLALPMIRVPVTPLAATARRELWRTLLPQLAEHAQLLAARYPIDAEDAREVVRDLGLRQALQPGPLRVDQVGECIRNRTPWHARAGLQRVQPRAGWSRLLLPADARQQLQAAVRRVAQQITVLDDWGFEQGAGGRRGLRLLFCGSPGTGKTLAAEAMAHELGVDLLVVDLSSLVSKWLGETEKNLAAVFDIAERARALLLFDEADALFGRRTEANDAHDRYANLETAYLLQRLERYEGVAVLTTNLSANLDAAFSRRFEYIVEFPEPDTPARVALWRLHLPDGAPMDPDVDLGELAAWYALTGAQIRNAALGAAFLAAAEGRAIAQRHFLHAIEREYGKAGRAHPGFPPNRHLGPAEAQPAC